MSAAAKADQLAPDASDDALALRLTGRVEPTAPVSGDALAGVLHLSFEQRARARLRARLDDGRVVGILLPRGTPLRHGDQLASEEGAVVEVRAAAERLSTARSTDAQSLARVAYHLGNRHVALQIEPDRLCWLHDHVLDAMVERLGLEVTAEQAPFDPEPGAYGDAPHHHSHHHHGRARQQGPAGGAQEPGAHEPGAWADPTPSFVTQQARQSAPPRQASDSAHQHDQDH